MTQQRERDDVVALTLSLNLQRLAIAARSLSDQAAKLVRGEPITDDQQIEASRVLREIERDLDRSRQAAIDSMNLPRIFAPSTEGGP